MTNQRFHPMFGNMVRPAKAGSGSGSVMGPQATVKPVAPPTPGRPKTIAPIMPNSTRETSTRPSDRPMARAMKSPNQPIAKVPRIPAIAPKGAGRGGKTPKAPKTGMK